MSKSTMHLGIITAPGYAQKISEGLKNSLPDLLDYYVDDNVEWNVDYITDALTGATEDSSEILGATLDKREEDGWDYAICLTDLPLFKGKRPIVAEAYIEENVALLSIPALGSTPLIKRIRESVLQLVNEMYFGSTEEEREEAEKRIQSKREENYNEDHEELRNKSSKRLVGKRLVDRLSPMQRETPDDEESNIDVRFTVKSRVSGALRILTGMVRANRPWAMFPSFMKLIVVAFATGAYALVFPTLWMLSSNYGIWRMLMLTLVSITAMVLWIILAHRLWEGKRNSVRDYLRKLYNTATLMTLFVTVAMYYFLLFVLFAGAVIILIPMGMLESQVNADVGYVNYFYIAWTATSVATIIGALGSALENEEVVLSAAYGYRQRQRYEEIKQAEEEKKEAQEEKKEAAEEKKEAAQEKKEGEKKKQEGEEKKQEA
ncbi:MFS transporter [Salimicrobium halophilum]|uniref:5,10-methylene-tetrahydrofolate dehydrogenase n=1 Tax=Salimicrobium halophilum TaxID=86666 RepID=A0A1G8R0Q3_9BACI|nr:hypothetical protein [Salimicrobium halophilum]SDJ10579.1 hypothetical protein SAMN04490247_0749 [Salimicrobium halophilum]